jgi:formylglycine-generating enzyme required for sulfatase activity
MRYTIQPARVLTVIAACACLATRADAGGAPSYDFQWATITDPGNVGYAGGPSGQLAGRGSVDYAYRISRHELTSAQFLEFVNTFWNSAQIPLSAWFVGTSGIHPDLVGPYVLREDLPNAAMIPVVGLNWRVSAQYCNWLHNGKSSDPSSLLSGAYDVSTFGTNPDGTFTDQLTRSPGAKFWIPSLDEWIKAAHYDPNRYGPGKGGWWESPNGTDIPLVNGPPGIGQTSGAGSHNWASPPVYIPLGSYADVQSPWGLWDVSGGAMEWTEEVIYEPGFGPMFRVLDGSHAGSGQGWMGLDQLWGTFGNGPESSGWYGLRIASVPCPSALISLPMLVFAAQSRRRKDAISVD